MQIETLKLIAWTSYFGMAVGVAATLGGGYMLGVERLTALLSGAEFPDVHMNATNVMIGGASLALVCTLIGIAATMSGQEKEAAQSRVRT